MAPHFPLDLESIGAALVGASRAPAPLDALRLVMTSATTRLHAAGARLLDVEEDEVLLHTSPHLTIYHITLTPGLHYPPHDHLMHALIGLYDGCETSFSYVASGSRATAPARQEAVAPSVLHLEPGAIHSVANAGDRRSAAIHVYLGDLTAADRHVWSPDGNERRPFHNDYYMANVRPIAG